MEGLLCCMCEKTLVQIYIQIMKTLWLFFFKTNWEHTNTCICLRSCFDLLTSTPWVFIQGIQFFFAAELKLDEHRTTVHMSASGLKTELTDNLHFSNFYTCTCFTYKHNSYAAGGKNLLYLQLCLVSLCLSVLSKARLYQTVKVYAFRRCCCNCVC